MTWVTAVAQIKSLAWEFPYATSVAQKKKVLLSQPLNSVFLCIEFIVYVVVLLAAP